MHTCQGLACPMVHVACHVYASQPLGGVPWLMYCTLESTTAWPHPPHSSACAALFIFLHMALAQFTVPQRSTKICLDMVASFTLFETVPQRFHCLNTVNGEWITLADFNDFEEPIYLRMTITESLEDIPEPVRITAMAHTGNSISIS